MSGTRGWQSLIRFEDSTGQVRYGEPEDDLKRATVWQGDSLLQLLETDNVVDVKQILAPYTPDTIFCIGLNYRAHAEEADMKIPSYPVLFHKSKNSINGPFSPVKIHPNVEKVDYENELCFVISKDAKDVSEEDAADFVLAYTVGNDVSSREWQAAERSGGQACFAKSFDGFCPFGPKLVSPNVVGDPQNLKMETKRNGKVVQSSNTSDMIFGVYKIISFMSQGTTIPAGALVMTGTPSGVAFGGNPQEFLKKGEVVECEIEKIGALKNEFA